MLMHNMAATSTIQGMVGIDVMAALLFVSDKLIIFWRKESHINVFIYFVLPLRILPAMDAR